MRMADISIDETIAVLTETYNQARENEIRAIRFVTTTSRALQEVKLRKHGIEIGVTIVQSPARRGLFLVTQANGVHKVTLLGRTINKNGEPSRTLKMIGPLEGCTAVDRYSKGERAGRIRKLMEDEE